MSQVIQIMLNWTILYITYCNIHRWICNAFYFKNPYGMRKIGMASRRRITRQLYSKESHCQEKLIWIKLNETKTIPLKYAKNTVARRPSYTESRTRRYCGLWTRDGNDINRTWSLIHIRQLRSVIKLDFFFFFIKRCHFIVPRKINR